MAPSPIDDTQLRTLYAQGHSQRAIARLLDAPKSTVAQHMKKLGLSPAAGATPPVSTQGTPQVHNTSIDAIMPVLHELVAWWQERQAALLQTQDASRQTERATFHVEKRWIDAIRRQADLDGTTYTQIVNEAFRKYFEGK
jgi:hypothetical protein